MLVNKALLTCLVLLTCLPLTLKADREAVKGLWAGPDSIFEVLEDEGEFKGIVRVVRQATYGAEEDPARAGQIRKDDNNPDAELRKRPLVGISMFSEYQYKDGLWQGKIYDPATGNTYQSRMEVDKDGRLKIRGYVGVPMFGRTAYFDPVASCEPHMVEMLAMLNDNRCQPAANPT